MSQNNRDDDLVRAYRASQQLVGDESAPSQTTRDTIAEFARNQARQKSKAANQPFFNVAAVASVLVGVMLGVLAMVYWPKADLPELAQAPKSNPQVAAAPPPAKEAPVEAQKPEQAGATSIQTEPKPDSKPAAKARESVRTNADDRQDKLKELKPAQAQGRVAPAPLPAVSTAPAPATPAAPALQAPPIQAAAGAAPEVAEATVSQPRRARSELPPVASAKTQAASLAEAAGMDTVLANAVTANSADKLERWLAANVGTAQIQVNRLLPDGSLPLTSVLRAPTLASEKLVLVKLLLRAGAKSQLVDQFSNGAPSNAQDLAKALNDDALILILK
jgi:hypothetical protein